MLAPKVHDAETDQFESLFLISFHASFRMFFARLPVSQISIL